MRAARPAQDARRADGLRSDLLRLDRRPDPFGLLLDRTAEHDAIDRFRRHERQSLPGLVFAGRNDQRLHAWIGVTFLQRQKQRDEAAAVDDAILAVDEIIAFERAALLDQVDARERACDDLESDLGAVLRVPS